MFQRLKSIAALAALARVPMTASALPLDCDLACECDSPYDMVCTIPGGRTVITCTRWCSMYAYVAPPEGSTVAQVEESSGTEELVCREPQQDAEKN